VVVSGWGVLEGRGDVDDDGLVRFEEGHVADDQGRHVELALRRLLKRAARLEVLRQVVEPDHPQVRRVLVTHISQKFFYLPKRKK
jgi:hypothetical protein